jgi:hypothetical protein
MARPCHGRGWAPEKLALDGFLAPDRAAVRTRSGMFFDAGRQPARAAYSSGLGGSARAGHPCYFQEAGARAQYLDTLSMLTPPDATFTKLDRFRRTRRTGCL